MAITAISPRYLDKISTKYLQKGENLAPDQKRLIEFSLKCVQEAPKSQQRKAIEGLNVLMESWSA